MTDTQKRTGGGGLPPSNIQAANTYNPLVGATTQHPAGFPPGTPLVQSTTADKTVVPGRANAEATSSLVGLAGGPGVAGSNVFSQFAGVLTLTTEEWDAITGQSGGLTRNAPYYLGSGFNEGQLTTTAPSTSGTFVARAGVALSSTDLLIQLCAPTAN